MTSPPGTLSPEVDAGLPPSRALEWLRLQCALAWQPQAASPRLLAGVPPTALLAALPGGGPVRPGTGGAGRLLPAEAPELDRIAARLERVGARVLPVTARDYPPALAALEDAPPVLLVRGCPQVLATPAIAIVGARAATRSGRSTARRLARELSEHGYTIVSGLARGIDGEAHRGALEAGGRSVGVLACGPERIYPPEHRSLAEELMVDGAIVSEMPPDTPPRRELFPLRNRIISGLCRAVVVVEARRRSGSLITVRHALDQGREVFVVPGAVDGPFAEGSNRLLREGARAICSSADLLEDLGPGGDVEGLQPAGPAPDASTTVEAGSQRSDERSSGGEPGVAARILARLVEGPASRDALLAAVEAEPGTLARTLIELELAGRVVEERDGRLHARWP